MHSSRFPNTLRVLATAATFLAIHLALPLARAQDPSPAKDSTAADAKANSGASSVEASVVKVFSTLRLPDPVRPWTKLAPRDISGSGVIIEGKRILTNAHVVLYATQVQVQANQAGDKISATVEFVAPGIDLAILKLDDESIFDTHPAIKRATQLPEVKDPVLVYGFPEGGTSLSITKGIVSRIEFTTYNFPTSGLRVQIDAAINPGNSGGPAVVGDKLVGIAFSHLRQAENIGYIIPDEEIELFLKATASGHYDGKPALYAELQTLENPALRAFLKLPPSVSGMIVTRPESDSPDYPLKAWDVITKIAGTPVDDQGMIKVGNIRVRFAYMVQQKAEDGKIALTVIRREKELQIAVPLAAKRPRLVRTLEGTYPSYFILGPMVFSPATDQLVSTVFSNTTLVHIFADLGNPMVTKRGEKPQADGDELVVVSSPFFPHSLSKGYSTPQMRVVSRVNDIEIHNLKHLVEVIRDTTQEFLKIEFAGRGTETIVLPRKAAIDATESILSDNGVRSQASADLLAVWNSPPKA